MPATDPHSDPAILRHGPEQDGLAGLVAAAVTALLIARMLIPAEAADLGNSLWITFGWFPVGMGAAWKLWRHRGPVWNLSLWDLAVGLLVFGHLLAGAHALMTISHPRATWNLLLEWAALGVSWICLRTVFLNSRIHRKLDAVLLLMAIAIVMLGIWQHYVWYPRQASEYLQIAERLQQLEAGPIGDSRVLREAVELQRTLRQMGVPEDPAQRQLWENRLIGSSEPLGTQALTNTFAGMLVVWSFLWMGLRQTGNHDAGRLRRMLVIAAVLATLLCLVLTKSRTAWIAWGLTVLAWYVVGSRHFRISLLTERWKPSAIAVLLLGLGLVVVTSLDREVLKEAPKSLQYRWEYWSGTTGVLGETPLWGVGPGNFRSRYLLHKPEGSSEEIGDPHNLYLDVWVNGGCVAFAGAVLLTFCLIRRIQTGETRTNDSAAQSSVIADGLLNRWTVGALIGAGLVLLEHWIWGDAIESIQMLMLTAAFLWFCPGVWSSLSSTGVPSTFRVAATVSLMLHLLGSGGIGMPAVMQLLLVLICPFATGACWQIRPSRVLAGGLVMIFAVGGMICLTRGVLPVSLKRAQIAFGNAALQFGRLPAAAGFFEQAAAADPADPTPVYLRAEVGFRRWQQDPDRSVGEFDRSVGWMEQSQELMPLPARESSRLAGWFRQRFLLDRDPANARRSLTYYQQAISAYPTLAAYQADAALLASRLDEPDLALRLARTALRLDGMNRQRGHGDKLLDDVLVRQLRKIADSGGILEDVSAIPGS